MVGGLEVLFRPHKVYLKAYRLQLDLGIKLLLELNIELGLSQQ
jgi:hypothetical protein